MIWDLEEFKIIKKGLKKYGQWQISAYGWMLSPSPPSSSPPPSLSSPPSSTLRHRHLQLPHLPFTFISLNISSPSYLSEVSEEQGLRGCFQQVPALSPEASSHPNDKKIFKENNFSSCKDIYFQYSREKKVTKRKFFLTLKWATKWGTKKTIGGNVWWVCVYLHRYLYITSDGGKHKHIYVLPPSLIQLQTQNCSEMASWTPSVALSGLNVSSEKKSL